MMHVINRLSVGAELHRHAEHGPAAETTSRTPGPAPRHSSWRRWKSKWCVDTTGPYIKAASETGTDEMNWWEYSASVSGVHGLGQTCRQCSSWEGHRWRSHASSSGKAECEDAKALWKILSKHFVMKESDIISSYWMYEKKTAGVIKVEVCFL